jgi:hypothetical protein
MRKYQAEIDRLNAPPMAEPEAEAGEAVAVVKQTKTERARMWLAHVLKDGPVPQKTVEALAIKDQIGSKALKTAKRKLRVQSVRKGRSHWVWQLPMASVPKDVRG